MTGLENLNAKAMLVDKEGDFWYYDGTRMHCIVEDGAIGTPNGVSTEYAARWAPFTQLMAADWANCLEEACATSDAAERELEDRNKELLEVYDSLVALFSLIKEWDENGLVNISEVAYPFPEAKALLAAWKITLNAPLRCTPRVERSKPGDGLTPADPAVEAVRIDESDLTQGARFKDRFGNTWVCEHGNLYQVIVDGIGQRGSTAVDPNGLAIQRYKPLIRIAPQNEQGNGLTLPDSNMHTVVTTLESEPKNGDLYVDIEGDVWLYNDDQYELLTVAGMRANPGVEHPDNEMERYKPLIKLVPESKT